MITLYIRFICISLFLIFNWFYNPVVLALQFYTATLLYADIWPRCGKQRSAQVPSFHTRCGPTLCCYLGIMCVLCSDLQVESPERVTEGDSVRLTCKSSCALTDRTTFIWYRNSQPLTERRDRNNQLLLQSVRREDAGRYSCAVHGHTYISPAVQLNVTCEYRFVSSFQ